jgi:hypothetical protein
LSSDVFAELRLPCRDSTLIRDWSPVSAPRCRPLSTPSSRGWWTAPPTIPQAKSSWMVGRAADHSSREDFRDSRPHGRPLLTPILIVCTMIVIKISILANFPLFRLSNGDFRHFFPHLHISRDPGQTMTITVLRLLKSGLHRFLLADSLSQSHFRVQTGSLTLSDQQRSPSGSRTDLNRDFTRRQSWGIE